MDNLFLKATPKTPCIDFNASTYILKLSGRVIPNNAHELFEPLKKWFEEFIKQPAKNTILEVRCEYLNGNSKFFLLLFHSLIELTKKGFEVKVKWYYEEDDPDMLEAGEGYEAFSGLPFEFVEISEKE